MDYVSSNFPLPVYQASWNMSRIRVASVNPVFKVESEVDEFITQAIADMPSFAVADYYQYWTDLTDNKVISLS